MDDSSKNGHAYDNEANKAAFQKWLARKRQEGAFDSCQSDSDDDDSDNKEERLENEKAYVEWLQRKKEKEKQMAVSSGFSVSRKNLAIVEFGNSEQITVKQADPNTYLRSYQTWIENKKHYTAWKREQAAYGTKSGAKSGRTPMSTQEIDRLRVNLLLNGITFNEWLGLKECEMTAARPRIVNSSNGSKNPAK